MAKTTQEHQCSKNEEIANSLTHGFGTLMSIVGLVIMVVLAVCHGDVWQVVSFSIFGSTLILLYLASTLYHSISHPTVKKFLKVFDHSAIYLLIAGTYTPFVLVTLRGAWGWSIFGIIWGLAIVGILLKCVFVGRFHNLAIAIYIFMGWFCLVASKQLLSNLLPFSLLLLILGGLSYTLGVIFYSWRKLPYNHAIWHLFVLAGSAFHYFSVLSIL
jgi:hemolysin III